MRDERWRMSYDVPPEPELESALEAMSAEELRSFLLETLTKIDDAARATLVDTLLVRAARGSGRWRPSGPPPRLVQEVGTFVEASRQLGHAPAYQVDAFLRQANKAFLATEYETARAIFELLLPPITEGEIDLGQHELVDEVLTVSVHECAAQYLVAVYATTPARERPTALMSALEAVQSLTYLGQPIATMERCSVEPLPDLTAFLPRWLEHLEQQLTSDGDWESNTEGWLREVAERSDGVAGLERIARASKKPQTLDAWCTTLIKRRAWTDALRACDEAARLVGESSPHWKGSFLDGAALAAQQLGRRDTTKRLKAAWIGAPSLGRLLRWLGAGGLTAPRIRKRSTDALARCHRGWARQRGLLHILVGDVEPAARLLSRAPGLGWSSSNHPGHLVFPAFTMLIADGKPAPLSQQLWAALSSLVRPPLEWDFTGGEKHDSTPRLPMPSISELLEVANPGSRLDNRARSLMLDAMRTAASKRVEGILGNKRRRHYSHAAALVACCLELAPRVDKSKAVSRWVESFRREYSRFYAFQRELREALAEIGS